MNDPKDMNVQSMAMELSQMFEQACEQQRALWERATRFSRDESLRFATLRLKRNNEALENFQGQDGFKNLAQLQQNWIRELVQDYSAQSVRLSETMSRITASAMAMAADAGREAMEEGKDAMRQGREAASENLDTMRQAGAEMVRTNHEIVSGSAESLSQSSQEYH